MSDIVPADDIVLAVPSRATEQRTVRTAIGVAGSAAWLAWQIDAGELMPDEARRQISSIADDLARLGVRLPEAVRTSAQQALDEALCAATRNDMPALAEAARRIRTTLEQYRNAARA